MDHFLGILVKLPDDKKFCFDMAVYFDEINQGITLITQLWTQVKLLNSTASHDCSETCNKANSLIVTIKLKVVKGLVK